MPLSLVIVDSAMSFVGYIIFRDYVPLTKKYKAIEVQ